MTIPPRNSAGYRAGVLISKSGPMLMTDLFRAVDFGERRNKPIVKVMRYVENGWLTRSDSNIIGITEFARNSLAGQPTVIRKDDNLVAPPYRPAFKPMAITTLPPGVRSVSFLNGKA
jgi:hypothetical protein